MAPEMAAEAMRAYAEETNRLNRERRASGEGHRSELAKIQRTLKQMLGAIEEGGHTRGMTERMRELEAREDVLKELLAQEPADIADIHPNVSGIYRKKVEIALINRMRGFAGDTASIDATCARPTWCENV